MAHLKLKTIFKGDTYTISKLYIDDVYFCDTIEDVVRSLPFKCPNTSKGLECKCKEKVYSKTAIPGGTYKVILSYSNRFKKILPEVLNVPHFLGIRIHSGNTAEDSAGCIIVGKNTVKGKVTDSIKYLNLLMSKLDKENTLEIIR